MSEYSTARVQGAFIMGHPEWERELQGHDLIAADFDRWLRRVQAEAVRDAAEEVEKRNAYSIEVQSSTISNVRISPQGYHTYGQAYASILRERADRIEQDLHST